eukprot:g32033.t1
MQHFSGVYTIQATLQMAAGVAGALGGTVVLETLWRLEELAIESEWYWKDPFGTVPASAVMVLANCGALAWAVRHSCIVPFLICRLFKDDYFDAHRTFDYGAIRKVHDHELPMAPVSKSVSLALANAKAKVLEEERPPPTFLTTVATKPAVGLVEPLHKSEKDIRTYIQKKREVFLVHMACDNKREEAVRLDAMAKAKEDALAFSQQTLEEDAKKFEDYLQERISKASHATKESEKHAKNKQDSVQSETGKLKEARVESERLKHFLEKLTPAEWKEEQKVKKEERKRERAQRWKNERLAPILEQLAIEDEKLSEKFAQEEAEAAELLRKKSKKSRRREDEDWAAMPGGEELLQKQRERDLRKKRIQKKREEEERKEPQQLMDTFTELEELNLFLIQSSQGTEQELDEMRHNFEAMKMDMGQKVQQLKDQIKQLEQNIKQDLLGWPLWMLDPVLLLVPQREDKKLSDLAMKVHDVYKRCDLARDQQQLDTLQMLGAIETRIEELIQGLDEAYQQDEELVMRLEWQKERDRRERARALRVDARGSLLRSQKPVFKKAGKQVMYRSPPLRQERKIVEDTTDDEAHARDHKVFDLYIDRKTGMPHTDAPTEEARRSTDTALSAPPPSSPKSQSMSEALESREVFM